MKLYRTLEEFKEKPNFSVVTSGMFDGVHLGHQKIIQRIKSVADEHNGETILITYWPHPRLVLSQNKSDFKLLTSLEEKVEELEKLGVDHLLCIPFTEEFSQLSSDDFIQKILIETLDTKVFVLGYDHHFGRNREGNFSYLQNERNRLPFGLEEIPKQDIENKAISSTHTRELIKSGKVKAASTYLGREYTLNGVVVHGEKLGSKLGFPTANIRVDFDEKLLPMDGVYAVRVLLKGELKSGMLNLGFRPTVSSDKKQMEVHIFDFDESIYGQHLKLIFVDRIRDEQKFSGLEKLKKQLKLDKEKALHLL